MDQEPTEELINLYKQSNAFVIPTLTTTASMTGKEKVLRDKFTKIGLNKLLLDGTSGKLKTDCLAVQAPQSKLKYAFQTIHRLHQEVIDVITGIDAMGGMKGTALDPSLWMELEMLVTRCGFSVQDALAAATSVAARRFGFSDRGIIEVGKRADLFLVKGDVTNNLNALWTGDGIVQVWKEGLTAEMVPKRQPRRLKLML